MSGNTALFVDQSGEIGGAELSMLDILIGRQSCEQVALLADGPFAKRLQDANIDVDVASLSIRVSKRSGLIAQLQAGPRILSVARRIAGQAKKHNVLIANTQKAAVIAALGARLGKRPMIWHLHDMLDAEHFSSANRRAVIALTNRWGQHVISNSKATDQAYRRAGGRLPSTVVYNGIDPTPFDAVSADATTKIRQDLGIEEGVFLAGVFGRLTPWKGQHVLLDALERDGIDNVQMLCVGDALFTDEDRRYAEGLRDRAAKGPLKGRVHFLGHRDDVPALMRACDTVVHTSSSPEPFGRVIVEGMLANKPVIATNAGGAREILEDGETGLLVRPGDPRALHEAIKSLRSQPSDAQAMAQAGRERAERHFSVEQMVEGVNRVIAQAVEAYP